MYIYLAFEMELLHIVACSQRGNGEVGWRKVVVAKNDWRNALRHENENIFTYLLRNWITIEIKLDIAHFRFPFSISLHFI